VAIAKVARAPRADDGLDRRVARGDHEVGVVQVERFDGDGEEREVVPIQASGERQVLDE
jgi:hypothetical protein